MRKVILLVAVFLSGMATEAIANQKEQITYRPGKKHRYYNSHSVSFVENGVLYTVFTDGSFDFQVLNQPYRYRRGRHNNANFVHNAPGRLYYKNNRRGFRNFVRTDAFGNIVRVGNTLINYKRNGRVKFIGRVQLRYQRGSLVRVGDMDLIYNRRGKIIDTYGHVNRYNRRFWHDPWNRLHDRNNDWFDNRNDDWDDDDRRRGNRNRNKDID